MNISAMFRGAVEEFDARVRQIGDHQWQAATPDEDWAVRDLVNHVVGEDLWAPPLLAGSTIAEVGDRFDGDVLGADPKAAWIAASAGAVRAVAEQGAMDRIVHLSFGDFPGREYALQLFADHLIHAWDLARAIGADERLDAGLVASCGPGSTRWRTRTAARARSRRGRRCPVMGTPRPCCWRVSGAVPDVRPGDGRGIRRHRRGRRAARPGPGSARPSAAACCSRPGRTTGRPATFRLTSPMDPRRPPATTGFSFQS